jgi:TetR/AcrR family transcriptional repressor of nem operon
MAPAGRPKSFDETAALEAAMAVFWAKGYDGTSMADLVEAMGIGRQSLYDTFGDKRGLYLRALRHYGESAITPSLAVLAGPGEPIDRIRTIFESWQAAGTCPDCKGCFMANALATLDRTDDDVAGLIDELQDRLTRGFEDAITQARAAGQITGDADPADLAAMLTAVGHGLSLAGRSRANTTFVPAAVRAVLGLVDSTATTS